MKKEKSMLCNSEFEFMEVVWDLEPVKSMAVKRECEKRYNWSHSTVFTLHKRLLQKNLIKNENTIITALVKREDLQSFDSSFVVNERFRGSLPSFVSSFCMNNKLSKKDIDEMKRLLKNLETDK